MAPISLALLLVGTGSAFAGDPQYRVIVNASRGITAMSRSDLEDCFTKRKPTWGDGVAVAPVDQTMLSHVRRWFTEKVLADSLFAVRAYWQQEIAAGRRQPPPVKANDEDVLIFVQAHAGAIGYVSGDTELPWGVSEVRVIGAKGQETPAAE